MQKRFIVEKIMAAILGLLFCIIILEIGLRLGGFIFLSLQEYRAAIQKKGTYRIMCLGESTTFSLGSRGCYPNQLEEILNQRNTGINFSVINKGIGGICTAMIVLQLEDNLNKYNPDMVITMMGASDGVNTVAYEDVPAKETTSFFKSLRIYKLVKLLRLRIINKAQKSGICKLREKKEDISTKASGLTQPTNLKEEKKIFEKTIEVNPENERAYIELGLRYRNQGEYDKAEEMFKRAIEINPGNEKTYSELGLCYRHQGRHDKAKEMFKKIIEINPGNERGCIGLGLCYRHQGKHDRAEEMFKRAIEINPGNDWTYAELGWYYRDQGKRDKAEEMFKRAIEINPGNDWTYAELGWCYRRQGKYDKVEEMLKEAIEINPRNEKTYAELGRCCEKQGKYGVAKEYFRRANRLRLEYYNPITRHNYLRLKEILTKRRVKLVCVQYPVRSVEPLKKIFKNREDILFVDNEGVFKEALKRASYGKYFIDAAGGDFGHFTPRGDRLLAENVADVILKEHFNIQP